MRVWRFGKKIMQRYCLQWPSPVCNRNFTRIDQHVVFVSSKKILSSNSTFFIYVLTWSHGGCAVKGRPLRNNTAECFNAGGAVETRPPRPSATFVLTCWHYSGRKDEEPLQLPLKIEKLLYFVGDRICQHSAKWYSLIEWNVLGQKYLKKVTAFPVSNRRSIPSSYKYSVRRSTDWGSRISEGRC